MIIRRNQTIKLRVELVRAIGVNKQTGEETGQVEVLSGSFPCIKLNWYRTVRVPLGLYRISPRDICKILLISRAKKKCYKVLKYYIKKKL